MMEPMAGANNSIMETFRLTVLFWTNLLAFRSVQKGFVGISQE